MVNLCARGVSVLVPLALWLLDRSTVKPLPGNAAGVSGIYDWRSGLKLGVRARVRIEGLKPLPWNAGVSY